jgi:hypothetical protein
LAALNHFTVPVSFIVHSFLAMEVLTAIEGGQKRPSWKVQTMYWISKAIQT